MKQIISTAGLLVAACVALAEPLYVPMACRINGTNAAVVVTDTVNPRGYITEIYIQAPTTSGVQTTTLMTNNICFIATPAVGSSLQSTVLYTNAALSTKALTRTRITPTDNAGNALSSLTLAEPFLCCGDPIVMRVSQASTLSNAVMVQAWLKIDAR